MQEPAADTVAVAGHRLRVALNDGREIAAAPMRRPGLWQASAAQCANRRLMEPRRGRVPGPTRIPLLPEARFPPNLPVAPPAH